MRMMIAILALLGTGCDGQNVTRPVVEDIEINYASPTWGANDLIVFDHVPLDSTGKSDYEQVGLYMINSDGTGFAVLALRRDLPGGLQGGLQGGLHTPRWSPDGEWLALGSLSDKQVYKLSPTTLEVFKLTDEAIWFAFPTWSPDGTLLAFSGPNGGRQQERGIFIVSAAGGRVRQLESINAIEPSWSRSWIP